MRAPQELLRERLPASGFRRPPSFLDGPSPSAAFQTRYAISQNLLDHKAHISQHLVRKTAAWQELLPHPTRGLHILPATIPDMIRAMLFLAQPMVSLSCFDR